MQKWKCRECGNETRTYNDRPNSTDTGKCDKRLVLAYHRQWDSTYKIPSNYYAHSWQRIEDYDPTEFALMTRSERILDEELEKEWIRRGGEPFRKKKRGGFLDWLFK
jgi:hypothetical protein